MPESTFFRDLYAQILARRRCSDNKDTAASVLVDTKDEKVTPKLPPAASTVSPRPAILRSTRPSDPPEVPTALISNHGGGFPAPPGGRAEVRVGGGTRGLFIKLCAVSSHALSPRTVDVVDPVSLISTAYLLTRWADLCRPI